MLSGWIDRAIKSMIWLLLDIKYSENQWLGKCEYSMRIIDCTLCIPMMKHKSFLMHRYEYYLFCSTIQQYFNKFEKNAYFVWYSLKPFAHS